MLIGLCVALVAAGALGGIAYGYRGQRDSERDQVTYLRKQIATLMGEAPPAQSRTLAPMHGGAR